MRTVCCLFLKTLLDTMGLGQLYEVAHTQTSCSVIEEIRVCCCSSSFGDFQVTD